MTKQVTIHRLFVQQSSHALQTLLRSSSRLQIHRDQVLEPNHPHTLSIVVERSGSFDRFNCQIIVRWDDLHRHTGDHDMFSLRWISLSTCPLVDWGKRDEQTGSVEEHEYTKVECCHGLRPEDQGHRATQRVLLHDATVLHSLHR